MKSKVYTGEKKKNVRYKFTQEDIDRAKNAYLCKPKGLTWKAIVDEMLSQTEINLEYSKKIPAGKGGFRIVKRNIFLSAGNRATIRHMITAKQIEMAMDGNSGAIADIQDRDYGKPRQALEHSLGSPLEEGQSDPDSMILAMIRKVMDK
jgi:hypothetical protein